MSSVDKEKGKASRPMASIARKINRDRWSSSFWSIIFLDLFLIAAVIVCFGIWHYNQLPDTPGVSKVYPEFTGHLRDFVLIFEDKEGLLYRFSYTEVYDIAKYPFLFLFTVQVIELITGLFQTRKIRRRMKPLNDLAIQAERVSRLSYDPSKMMELARAIESVSPEEDEVSISTGDKDLQSIEIALNNLLRGMKESEKRQMRFVDDASHELRTPIAVIQGYAELLDRWGKEDPEVLNESISAIRSESEQMKNLVEQLLFLARGDNGRNQMQKSLVDLNEVLEAVYEESLMIDEAHTYSYDPKEVSLFPADLTMLKQSIRIFVQNAAKYSPAGTNIQFRTGENETHVWYEIQDEGIGMEEQDVVHVFERFYRSDAARNSKTGGSGLGLSIAKWIVDAHKGNIELLSRPDIGTRFTVYFPK